MTTTTTPYRPGQHAGRDGFPQVLRAEWTKLRTVRGWVIAAFAAAAATALAPVALSATATNPAESCAGGRCQAEAHNIATGPGGAAVTDTFYFVHQALTGNGSITARVSGPRGLGAPAGQPATEPWAKAGLIVKASTTPGSAYAAIMNTGGHGVAMQYDYAHSTAGAGGAAARWLRLARSGDTVTGYYSADGRHWAKAGTATLAGLPATVQAGLFVASPDFEFDTQSFGGGDQGIDIGTRAAATFGGVSLRGGWAGHAWHGDRVGTGTGAPAPARCGQHGCVINPGQLEPPGSVRQAGGTFAVTGSGDIAPYVPVVDPVEAMFYGTLFGVIAVIALGAVFITAEYRRGLIRTTLAASPRRARVLAAKAIVIGLVTFAAGLAGAAVAFTVTQRRLSSLGWRPPVWHGWSLTSATGVQVVVGTAALLAVTALLALAAGTILRRSAGAVTAVMGVVIVPLILAVVLPTGPADLLMRLTPAAAFGLQQTTVRYPQVITGCTPYHGCYPLAPWPGFAVMCAWAVAALVTAAVLLRRRDA